MKNNFYLALMVILFLTLGVGKSWGQTCGCSFIGSYQEPPSFLVPDFTTSWQYLRQTANGAYTVFQVTNGVTYEWSYCAPGSIVPSGYDLRLNLYRCIATPCTGSNMQSITCNGDYCGLNPRISWTATFSGNVYLQINNYVSSANPCDASSSAYFTLGFRILSGCGLTNITPTIVFPGTVGGPGPEIPNTTPTLNWNAVAGATNYSVYISIFPYGSSNIIYQTCVSGNSHTVPSGTLTNGNRYRWNIQANVSCGSCVSQNSSPLHFQTPAPPNAPVATAATNIGRTSFTANWNASTGAASYRLDVAINSGFTIYQNGYQDKTVSGLSNSVTGLTGGINYWYRVRAVNSNGTPSVNSNTIATTTTDVTEHNSSIPNSYSISQNYPNPFNPTTTIEFALPKSSEVTLKIFDMLGIEVATLVNERLNAGTFKVEWDAKNMPSGTYFYRIHAGDFVATKKLMLMK